MTHKPVRFEQAALETILDSLLAEHPDAFVAAIDPEPIGRFVPIPSSLHLRGQAVLEARTALDLVVPADRGVVISAWEEARATGVSRSAVRLAVAPDAAATMHFVDARVRHRVYMVVIVSDASALERLAQRVDVSPLPPRIGRVRKDALAVIVEVDAALLRILGWTAEQMTGHRSLEFVHPDDQEQAIRDWMQMLETPGPMPPVRQRHRRADGSWTWFEVTNHNQLADPAVGVVVAEMIDISHEMAAEEALRAREKLLRRLAEALPIGVLQATADGRIVYTNERLHRILGAGPAPDLAVQLATVAREDRPALDVALESALRSGIDGDLEIQIRPTPDDRARRCMVRLRALADELGTTTGAILTLEDVTESARLRAELERRATHDMLTRVMNRASVIAVIEDALARPGTNGTAAIFVDLDRFKAVNDSLGHAAGDELLRIVADRLAIAVRADDALGRIGGDEFLVVCSGIRGVGPAQRVAERISRALCRSVHLAGTTLDLQASLGVAYSGRRPITADALVARADAAMYESKRQGLGRPVVYSADLARTSQVA
ncbi:MAG TPA: diguanylate cyclase [Coriobacteriia bacterium]|jgi:diguanylate cyclase (GGDEF)-like protein/PAS domain S-box-containing protein